MKRSKISIIALSFFLGVLLFGLALTQTTAGQSSFLGITLTPSATPVPTEVPTLTPVPTNTQPPTNTPVPTNSPVPTNTPDPTLVNTPTFTPTASPTPLGTQVELMNVPSLILPHSGIGAPSFAGLLGLGRQEDLSSSDITNAPAVLVPGIDLPFEETSPIERIHIESLKISANVVPVEFEKSTWDISKLALSVGWLAETSLPGQGGNTVLTGHVSTSETKFPPFKTLKYLRRGDLITVETQLAVYVYQVRTMRIILPTDRSVLQPGKKPQLTLLTCAVWNRTIKEYTRREVVTTVLVSASLKQDTGETLETRTPKGKDFSKE